MYTDNFFDKIILKALLGKALRSLLGLSKNRLYVKELLQTKKAEHLIWQADHAKIDLSREIFLRLLG